MIKEYFANYFLHNSDVTFDLATNPMEVHQRHVAVRRPEATRPWQHVLEPLHGYMTLARHLWDAPEAAGAYNFGPRRCWA